MSKALKRNILEWVGVILAAVAFAVFINSVVIVNASVPSGSMMDTIPEQSRLVAFRLSYLFEEPQRYDVVVFKFPDDESKLYVKRIIGMPGETVEIIDGKVYINGSNEPLDDYFVRDEPYSTNGPYEVPEGYYFMLGDNRNNSEDSRYWTNKFVSRYKMLGKAIFCYFPVIKLIE